MTDQPQQPSFLKARLAAAREKANATTQIQTKPQPQPKTLIANHKPTAKPPKKGGKSRISEDCEPENPQTLGAATDLAVVRAMMARSADAEMAEIARPYLTKVFEAIMVGAMRPGREGTGDRQTLFKMLGLPWSNFAKGVGADGSSVATDRLATALSRLERRLGGQEPVTVDIEGRAEPVPIMAADEVGHMMMDRLPSPPTSSDRQAAAGVNEVDEAGLEGAD